MTLIVRHGGAGSGLSRLVARRRAEILARWSVKRAARGGPPAGDAEGIPRLLDQIAGGVGTAQDAAMAVHHGATQHGLAHLRQGGTIAELVHDYGDVGHAIAELAREHGVAISGAELAQYTRWLADAVAAAAAEYERGRAIDVAGESLERVTAELGALSYELRNAVWSATLAFEAITAGGAGFSGSTSAVMTRTLTGLRELVDRSFEIMKAKGRGGSRERVSIGRLFDTAQRTVSAAAAHGVRLGIEIHDAATAVETDLQIVAPIVAQLLENAYHHTPAHGHVTLRSSTLGDRLRVEVEDECGGLAPAVADAIHQAFAVDSLANRGLGLGLARRAIAALGGTLDVRDLPGRGCVFAIELPGAPSRRA
jgi:signal transduction histidine kinase